MTRTTRISLFLLLGLSAVAVAYGVPVYAAKETAAKQIPSPPVPEAKPVQQTETSTETDSASETGLPLPRFAALRFDEVNVRTGPGTRYPIRWVYKRKNLPVEITEEFGDWRLLKDIEGDEGWSHKSQLTGSRSVVIREDIALKRYPSEDSPPMLKARKGVIAHLLECEAEWCEVQVQSYKAWAKKHHLWGVYAKERIK